MKNLPQHHLYVNNTWTKFKGKKFYQKKFQNLLTCVVVKCFSLLSTLTTSQRLNSSSFAMKLLEQKLCYVNNILSRIQGQKINKKKDINNLPTCFVLRNNCGNYFTTSTLTPSQGLKIFLFTMKFFPQSDFYVNNLFDKFQSQNIYTKKDIQKLPTCIAVRNHFNIANFDTLLRAEFFLLTMQNLA